MEIFRDGKVARDGGDQRPAYQLALNWKLCQGLGPANLRSPVAVDSSGRFPAGLCFSILGKFSSPHHSLSNVVLSFSFLSTKEGPDSPARPEKLFIVIFLPLIALQPFFPCNFFVLLFTARQIFTFTFYMPKIIRDCGKMGTKMGGGSAIKSSFNRIE